MINYLLLSNIILIIIIVLGVWLAFWVYFANRKEKINRGFALMVFSIISWVAFYDLASLYNQREISLILFRIATGSVFAFFITAYYFFIIWFLKKRSWYLFFGRFILTYGLIFGIFATFTDFIISYIKFEEWGIIPIFTFWGWFIFYGSVIFLAIFINGMLLLDYFKYSAERRFKIQYFLTGIFIFAGLNFIFNIILPVFLGVYRFYQLGNYSVIFLLVLTAYAIVKRELFEIKVVFTAILVGIIALLFLLDVLFFTSDFSFQVIKSIIFFLFLYFGYLLIRSVILEIKNREEMERISLALTVAHIKLEAAYKSLEKLDRVKSEFISMVSHQLKTPLSIIKGYISMILEGSFGPVSDKVREKLKNVFQSNERLLKLVNDLLNISKIEFGKMELDKEYTQIEDLIQSCVDELKIAAENKGLKLIFEKSKELLPKISIDSLKIRQVIFNLIDNAIKYTLVGEVRVKAEIKNSNILISIQDTGEGLTKEEQKNIFKGFMRGRAGINMWVQGTGVGLWLAKKYLELHKGRIWSKSFGEGKGSTFFVELPIK